MNLAGGSDPASDSSPASAPHGTLSAIHSTHGSVASSLDGCVSSTHESEPSEGAAFTKFNIPLHSTQPHNSLPNNALGGNLFVQMSQQQQQLSQQNELMQQWMQQPLSMSATTAATTSGGGGGSAASSVTSSAAAGAPATPLIPTLFGKKVDLPSMAEPLSFSSQMPESTKFPSMLSLPLKRGRDVLAVSEDESERERRRQDRNLREQQRSHQINDQICDLRDMLIAAGIRFKPDKYSTLAMVADYIKTLQDKKQTLESEHQSLLQTITQTAQTMTEQYIPAHSTAGAGDKALASGYSDMLAHGNGGSMQDEACPGIDYKAIFSFCNLFGSSITSIDGRFLDCNKSFENVCGFSRSELLPLNDDSTDAKPSVGEDGVERNLSLFNILAREDMERVFHTMSELLKRPVTMNDSSEDLCLDDTWTTLVTPCRRQGQKVQLSLSLVRTADRRPRLFNCTLIPREDSKLPFSTTG